jgi:hypothetical protein
VGDQRVHLLRMAGGQVEPGQRPAAAAQHVRRSIGEDRQEMAGVVALDLHRQAVGEVAGRVV